MIDYLIRFNSEKEAQADKVCGAYYLGGGAWRDCIAGVRAWQVSQDQTVVTNSGETAVIHQYLPYWYLTVTTAGVVPALRDHPLCMLAIDSDRAAPGASLKDCVIISALPLKSLSDYRLSVVRAGTSYPFGGS